MKKEAIAKDSIESRLYSEFYGGFERLEEKVAAYESKGNPEAVYEWEEKQRGLEKMCHVMKYVTAGLALWSGTDSAIDIMNHQSSNGWNLMLSASFGLLSLHFHYFSKLEKSLYDKIFRKEKTVDKAKISLYEKLGRNTHFGGVVLACTAMAPVVYEAALILHPVINGLFLGALGMGIYHNWIKCYNALYRARADFINGEKRYLAHQK